MLLIYSIGLSVTESENWNLINRLLFDIRKRPLGGEIEPLILSIHPFLVGRNMNNGESFLKERMKDNLRSPLRSVFSGENNYEEAFCEFGFLMDMVLADASEKIYGTGFQPARSIDRGLHNSSEVQENILSKGADWGPLQVGLLGGSEDRMNELAEFVCNTPFRA
jgi:hypothetical protein